MKILALMPQEKMMYSQAVQSLFAFQQELINRQIGFQIAFTNGMYITVARTQLAKFAVKTDADYIIWLDSDHIYKAEDALTLIRKMEENSISMLSAKYYVRNDFAHRRIAACRIPEGGVVEQITPEPGETGIKSCDAVGFGFLVMKPDLLRDLSEKYDPLFKMSDKEVIGEDLYFCSLAKKEGYRVAYDADTIVGHISIIVNR